MNIGDVKQRKPFGAREEIRYVAPPVKGFNPYAVEEATGMLSAYCVCEVRPLNWQVTGYFAMPESAVSELERYRGMYPDREYKIFNTMIHPESTFDEPEERTEQQPWQSIKGLSQIA